MLNFRISVLIFYFARYLAIPSSPAIVRALAGSYQSEDEPSTTEAHHWT
jgi:hypothetical protein